MSQPGDQTEEDDSRRPHELRRLRVDEISLVDRPANMRPFLLFKRDSKERSIKEMPISEKAVSAFEKALNAPANDEDQLVKTLGDMDEASDGVARGAIRLLGTLTEAQREAIGKAFAPTPETKVTIKSEPVAGEFISKADHDVELQKRDARILTLEKQASELVEKADNQVVNELLDRLDMPGEREEQFAFVKAMSPEQRSQYEKVTSPWSAIRDLSELGKEIGTSRRGETVVSASAEVEKRVDAFVAKAEGKVNRAELYERVFKEDPKLYASYRQEAYSGVK
jgi:hypothetical protein